MIDLFIDQQRSENTKKAYQSDLSAWEDFLGSADPTEEVALAWRDHLMATMAINSAVRRWNTVRTYYDWARIPSPFDRIKGPRRVSNWVPKPPDHGMVDQLIETCTNVTDRAIMALLANGLRAEEVCTIKPSDLRQMQGAWVLRVIGKGNKLRMVPLNNEVVKYLGMYSGGNRSQLFPRLNRRRVYYIVTKWAKKAGLKGMHPHLLRHDYATRLIRAGMSVFHLQPLMGHARADTTGLYVNLDMSDLITASRLDPRQGDPAEHGLRAVG